MDMFTKDDAKEEGNNGYVSGDFAAIIQSIFSGDRDGRKMYSDLVDSGKLAKIKELWEMGGMPGLRYSKKDPIYQGTYNRDPLTVKEGAKAWWDKEWSGGGVINIHGGSNLSSAKKFSVFIAELSHAIGFNNPSMMKLGVKEFNNEWSSILGSINSVSKTVKIRNALGGSFTSKAGPTYEFLRDLDTFPVPENPTDSLKVWGKWWESQSDTIRKDIFRSDRIEPDVYEIEGHYENITHDRIETAINQWLWMDLKMYDNEAGMD